MKKIKSNEYYDAVKEYFANNKEPARVYRFFINILREDEFKLSDDMIYVNVDTLETTDVCFYFYTGNECILVLCSK